MAVDVGEMLDFPELQEFRVGNVWRKPRPGLARLAGRLLTGPRCLGGVAVDFRKVDVPLGETASWSRLEGTGLDARPGLRYTWRHAAHLALPAGLIREVEKLYGAADVKHAVARVTANGDVVAGPLPEGVSFGVYNPHDDEDDARRTLLCRVGPSSVLEIATPALLLAHEGKLLVPDKVEVLDPAVPLRGSSWAARMDTPVV